MTESTNTPPYRPFPSGILPEPIKSYIRQGARACGCDQSFIGLPLFSALAAAIGNKRSIQLKKDWIEPCVIWTATVAKSGQVKSPGLKLALKYVRKKQDESFRQHNEAMQLHETEQLNYEREFQDWKRKRSGDPPVKPDEPKPKRFICADVTVESLAPLLLDNPDGLLLARDELNGWFNSFDRYASGGRGDSAHWLEMFGAQPMLVDRKTGDRKSIYVPKANVSVTGSIQPRVLDKALGDEHFCNGMAARFCMCMPPPRIKKWTDAELSQSVDREMSLVFDYLYSPNANTQLDSENNEVLASLSDDALSMFKQFSTSHCEEQAGLPEKLGAHWSKLEGLCARFALVIHTVRWAAADASVTDVNTVDAQSVTIAIYLIRWFGEQAERVYEALQEDAHQREIRERIELIWSKGGRISVRDYQRSYRRLRGKPQDAYQELRDLAVLGHGGMEVVTQGEKGGRPSEVFYLYDQPGDANTQSMQRDNEVLASSAELVA